MQQLKGLQSAKVRQIAATVSVRPVAVSIETEARTIITVQGRDTFFMLFLELDFLRSDCRKELPRMVLSNHKCGLY